MHGVVIDGGGLVNYNQSGDRWWSKWWFSMVLVVVIVVVDGV